MGILEQYRKAERERLVGELLVLAVGVVGVGCVVTCFYTLVKTILAV